MEMNIERAICYFETDHYSALQDYREAKKLNKISPSEDLSGRY